jgi:antitoxin component YwqK of YwqJK toxin-antitoxin module
MNANGTRQRWQGPRAAILGAMSEPSPESEVTYYANGKIKYRGANLDGQMHGPWEFFRTDGSLMRAGRFDRGRQIGTWRTFDRDGRVVKEIEFG